MRRRLQPGPSLFPILQPSPLVGMARLAAESTHADDGHLIDFRAMQPKSLLNRSVSKRQLKHEWSINPFRGCEFGCKYCYARYTHEFLEPVPIDRNTQAQHPDVPQSWALAFERQIYMKENAAWLLEQELKQVGPGEEIAIGTATDPYQPIERRAGITRSILEVLARRQGLRIGLITKSTLITRDIDLLQQIAARNTLVLHVTITTTDSALARSLEPRAPRPDLRFATVRKLREAGLIAGVLSSPLLPGINDTLQSLEQVAGMAAAAGASFLGAHPLFLKSCSRPTFLSYVREHHPHLAADYATRFANVDFADATTKRRLAAMVTKVCRKYGLGERSTDALLTKDVGLQDAASYRKPMALATLPPPNTCSEPSLFAVA